MNFKLKIYEQNDTHLTLQNNVEKCMKFIENYYSYNNSYITTTVCFNLLES